VTIGWLALQDTALRQACIDVQYFGSARPGRASELQAIMTLRASDAILKKTSQLSRTIYSCWTVFLRVILTSFSGCGPPLGPLATLNLAARCRLQS
jgi:hypothetical protein